MITKYQLHLNSVKPIIFIYLTALEQISKISVNIRLPAWLGCAQKNNNFIEQLERDKQNVSNFIVERKEKKDFSCKKNYGDFPRLNIAYFVG